MAVVHVTEHPDRIAVRRRLEAQHHGFTPCDGGCMSRYASGTTRPGRKAAAYTFHILDYPVAALCENCAKQWLKWFEEYSSFRDSED